MKRKFFLAQVIGVLAASLSLALPSIIAAAQRPNIIILFADDLGWTGTTAFGSDLYETPNLDRLAKQGMKFTDAYSGCTVCSPSRAALMTGKYPARLHLTDFIAGQNRPYAKMRIPEWNKGLPASEVTIAEALKASGYATAHIGKWHLNYKSGNVPNNLPTDHGFDVSVSRPGGARGYFLKKKRGEKEGGFLTDYLTDQALKVIDDNQKKPFFLYFAYNVPHTPIQGKQALIDYYANRVRPGAKHVNPTYAAMVHSLDESAGRILRKLDELGLDDNALVIFTSDNGGLTQRYGKHDGFTENLPLRRGKGSAYEGGVRVPMIAKWPGVIAQGTVCDEPVIGIDFYPTLLEVAGAQREETHVLDGSSLMPLFKDASASLERKAIYWHYPHYHAGGDGPYGAVRAGNWRYVQFYEDGSEGLYHLGKDIGESKNLAVESPEITERLRGMLAKWSKEIDAQMPTPNPNFNAGRQTEVEKNRKR